MDGLPPHFYPILDKMTATEYCQAALDLYGYVVVWENKDLPIGHIFADLPSYSMGTAEGPAIIVGITDKQEADIQCRKILGTAAYCPFEDAKWYRVKAE